MLYQLSYFRKTNPQKEKLLLWDCKYKPKNQNIKII